MKKITLLAASLFVAVSFGQVVNGDFSTAEDGTTGAWIFDNTKWTIDGTGAAIDTGSSDKNHNLTQTFEGLKTDGTVYTISFDAALLSGSDAKIRIRFESGAAFGADGSTGNTIQPLSAGANSEDFLPSASSVEFSFDKNANASLYSFDNVVVTEKDSGVVLSSNGYTVAQIKANAIAYFNLLGQEIANPTVGEVYIVKYKSTKGVNTAKVLF